MNTSTHTHALVYVGAPYGDNEGGNLEYSGTEDQCKMKMRRLGPLLSLERRIVELDARDNYRYAPMSAREYFKL